MNYLINNNRYSKRDMGGFNRKSENHMNTHHKNNETGKHMHISKQIKQNNWRQK